MDSYPIFTVEQVDAAMKNHSIAGMGVAVARQVLILGESLTEAAGVLDYSTNVGRRAVKTLLSKINRIAEAYRHGASPDRLTEAQFYCCITYINRITVPADVAYEVLVLGKDRLESTRRNCANPNCVMSCITRILAKHHKFIHAYGGNHEQV